MTKSSIKRSAFRLLAFVLCLTAVASAEAQAQTPGAAPSPSPSQVSDPSLELRTSLGKSLLAEQEAQQQLQKQLERVSQSAESLNNEINTQRILISTYSNLLLIPDVPAEDLQKAQENIVLSVGHITSQSKELIQERNELEQKRLDTQKQYLLNEKQIAESQAELEKSTASDRPTEALLGDLRQLTLLLSMKQELIETIYSRYNKAILELEQIRQDFEQLANSFESKIAERKKQELFTRQKNPLEIFGKEQFFKEFDLLLRQIRIITSPDLWIGSMQTLWQTEGILLLRFTSFLALIFFLLFRLRRFFSQALQQLDSEREPWRCLITQLLQRSLALFGVTLSMYLYVQSRPLYSPTILKGLLLPILLIVLFTRWLLDTLRFWKNISEDSPFQRLVFHERLIFLSIRYLMIVYVIFEWALGTNSIILTLGRVVFEIIFFFWSFLFWEQFRKIPEEHFPGSLRAGRHARAVMSALGHIVVSGGLLIELAGYGILATYWYISWWHTLIVVLWSCLIFLVLREWEAAAQSERLLDGEHEKERAAHQIRWLLVRISWMAWPLFALIGLLVAWGEMDTVLRVTLTILTFSVPIGGINLSLLGMIYALLILLTTHVLTRLWERLLKEKILANSALEPGVQISICTISGYLLWLFGILWALNALGIGTTSIAVAFGALGIGIGFGLQSIFNNFLSGLILLFERPIEVGDVLEVSGSWGVVEKINVRSTVIRTYDNSALIIPNADIISNQLTNWTFKDVRVRRTIQVGVAYGSDVRLVEQTLYEIAEKHARVMTDPAPMVLFSDFGESSLIFKLRVWTLLDYGLSTETEIRFEIDKIFREKHITIAFPQLDVHLDSPPEEKAPDSMTERSALQADRVDSNN